MQRPVIRLGIKVTAVGLLGLMCLVGIFLFKILSVRGAKQNPMEFQWERGKISTAFSQQHEFEWVDLRQGEAQIHLQLVPRNFSPNQWTYRWILPKGVTSKNVIGSHFTPTSPKEELKFFLHIEGLDQQENQNIIFELMPVGQQVGGLSVVIPSFPEQTQEGQIIKEFQSSPLSPKSFTTEIKKIPKGIRF